MKKCLCCGKPLHNEQEEYFCWHDTCVKKFFGTSNFPDIDVSEDILKQLATSSVNNGYTVPGVQKKISLHLTKGHNPRLTLVNYPTGYILKPQTEEYDCLPELEFLIMQMAKISGISTVPFALIKLFSQNSYAYITKRVDRVGEKMLAMEDFCQLDGRLTEDKYRGSYERCGKIIEKHSEFTKLDVAEMFLRIVFSFIVGNSDMHLKNFSLLETEEGSEKYILSPAYDMLSTNVVIPSDKEQLALTLNGKKRNINRKDFLMFAEDIGLQPKQSENMINKLVKLENQYISMCDESYLPKNMKELLSKLIKKRILVLQ